MSGGDLRGHRLDHLVTEISFQVGFGFSVFTLFMFFRGILNEPFTAKIFLDRLKLMQSFPFTILSLI